MSQRTTWRIYLTSFLPPASFLSFFLSGLNSAPPHSSLFPTVALAHPHTCLPLCQCIFRLPSCRLRPHSPFPACHSVTLFLSLFPFLYGFSPYLCNFLTRPPCPVCLCFAANVCDEEMLLCQNGGTCFQNQKCICPPEFKGVLCQQSRCEAGKDCNAASSLRPATLLICTLLAHMLAMLTPH